MNLPIFNPLFSDSSTYITFSKSLLDFDSAIENNSEYYFSKMVAFNLPNYQLPDFFVNQTDMASVGVNSTNPNTTIPKGLQFYMENIIRQNTGGIETVTELAFYKFLNYCGISYSDIHSSIVYINKIMTSNFIKVENNNGWGEIVCVVPNNSKKLILSLKDNIINDVITSSPPNNGSNAIYDNNNKEFLFTDPLAKKTIDFDNISYNSTIVNHNFDFNIILVFYKDSTGVDKLHGINFINPFDFKLTYFDLPTYTRKSNDSRSVGYQFKMNMKTVNNEASRLIVEEYNDGFWTSHFETLSKLNSFLEIQMLQPSIINP